jgi:hypothetical protein
MPSETHLKLLQAIFTTKSLSSSRKDETLTLEVQEKHQLADDAVRVTKNLMKPQTADIRQNSGAARRFHLAITFAGIAEARLLTVAEQARYADTMRQFRDKHNELVADFIARYETDHMQYEREKHGETFRVSDYPARIKLPALFEFAYSVIPMPDPNSFLQMRLIGNVAAQLKESYERQLAAASANITVSIQQKILELIGNVAETLSDPDAPLVESEKRKGPIGHLREYLDRVPAININDDPLINEMVKTVREKIELSVEKLRVGGTYRTAVAAKARSVAAAFGAYGAGRKLAA